MKRTLFWKIFPTFLGIVFASLLALGWFASHGLRTFFMERMQRSLETRAKLLAHTLQEHFPAPNQRRIDEACKRMGEITGSRITVITPGGQVLGDSHVPWQRLDLDLPAEKRIENHADRPEIRLALEGETGVNRRYSTTLRQNMIYVAVPLSINRQIAAVVRTSRSLRSFETALSATHLKILAIGVIVGLAAFLLSFAASRRLTRPLAAIRQGLQRFAGGDLKARLPAFDIDEFQLLGRTINDMAAHLDDRIRTVIQQRNEVEAILSSMAEGVLAVDSEQRIIKLNRAATTMLGIRQRDAQGKAVQTVLRNAGLQKVLVRTLTEEEPVSEKIVFYNDQEHYFKVSGELVKDAANQKIGAVLVLNDITQMRKLENLRKDFVANVSHEIRTPITSIQGFVETLLDGALHNTEDAERFLEIIHKQTTRLNAIIEDLLLLSRVEGDGDEPSLRFERHNLRDILLNALQVCEAKARDHAIELSLDCPADIEAVLNPLLMEQAVVNMIDNAINYSPPESRIDIRAEQEADEAVISVTDRGCGIPQEALPRIFERFYRVDKARSRQLGGTGLGLAILKHIAQAHGGRVSVDSSLGHGSCFRIHLPLPPPE